MYPLQHPSRNSTDDNANILFQGSAIANDTRPKLRFSENIPVPYGVSVNALNELGDYRELQTTSQNVYSVNVVRKTSIYSADIETTVTDHHSNNY